MNNAAINFNIRYIEFKLLGYNMEQSFHLAAQEFIRKITMIKLTRRKGKLDARTYFFKDGTRSIYQDNYFKVQFKN